MPPEQRGELRGVEGLRLDRYSSKGDSTNLDLADSLTIQLSHPHNGPLISIMPRVYNLVAALVGFYGWLCVTKMTINIPVRQNLKP